MPSPFNPEKFERVLALHAEGKTIREICKADWAPDTRSVYRWKSHSVETERQYDQARLAFADAMFEETIEISNGKGDPQRDKLRCDVRRWAASKVNPRQYGEKMEIEVTPKLDLIGAIEAGKRRLLIAEGRLTDGHGRGVLDLTANPDPDDEDGPYPDFLD